MTDAFQILDTLRSLKAPKDFIAADDISVQIVTGAASVVKKGSQVRILACGDIQSTAIVQIEGVLEYVTIPVNQYHLLGEKS